MKSHYCYLTGDGALDVHGVTPHLYRYTIEITDAVRAAKWAKALGGRRYHRLSIGSPTDHTYDRRTEHGT